MIINTHSVGDHTLNTQRVIPIIADPTQTELCNDVALMLLGKCNLDCEFCLNKIEESNYHKFLNQDFDADLILKYLDSLKVFKEHIMDQHDINLTLFGGELFQDRYDYTIYDQLLTGIEEIFADCIDSTSLSIFSNFLFKDCNRVVELLNKHADKIDITLTMSFDLVGRYTKPYMIPRVLQNYQFLHDHCLVKPKVTITGHRLNMEAIMNHGENFETFLKLYNDPKTTITFSNYINNPHAQHYKIDGKLLETFWLYMLKHYPKVSNIQGMLNPIPREQSKGCHELIMIGDTLNRCCNNVATYLNDYQTKFGCLYCDYYQYCNEICYFSQHNLETCWRKTLFEEINKQKLNN